MPNTYGAMSFGASTQYLSASHNANLNLGTNNFTIDFAVKSASSVVNDRLVFRKHDGTNGIIIEIDGMTLKAVINAQSITITTLTADVWNSVRLLFDRGEEELIAYVNGVLINSFAITDDDSINNSATIYVGGNGSVSFGGEISEIRISSELRVKALSPDDDPLYSRISQYPDDAYVLCLWHFNEGRLGTTVYDLSSKRIHLTVQGTPSYTAGPYEMCIPQIVREQIWLAIDSYSYLTTWFSNRSGYKFRNRFGDPLVVNPTVENCPALVILPTSLPEIQEETSSFHNIRVPLLVKGYMHNVDVSQIENFWWIVTKAIWKMYDRTTTSGRFNLSCLQHMKSVDVGFEIHENEDESLFSSFSQTFIFDVRHDFLEPNL